MRPRLITAENGVFNYRGAWHDLSFNEAAAHHRGERTRRNPLRFHVFTTATRGLTRS